MNARSKFLFLLCLLHPILNFAQYRIKGKVNVSPDWQPQIYLAAIDKLNDYYRASADLVIQIAPIQADGSFEINGDNLPDDPRFYRLYLMKEQNQEYDACLYFGLNDHNFIHLVLHNSSQLDIQADTTTFSPFGNYRVQGDETNQLMRQLSNKVYPNIEFYSFRFPTEQKLAQEKLHQDLKYFSDTCQNALVSLAAVNYTDFDEYFETDRYFYEDFGERLKATLPHSVYTQNYFRKLNYYAFEEGDSLPNWVYWTIGGLTFGLLLVGGLAVYFYKKSSQQNRERPIVKIPTTDDLYEKLTLKEREILALILAGKPNKEIASDLFIGLSTVKTHINKIYA
ncbi:MAG: helix-turn-helix transcriptional regulator, partial [Bacteroidota bacterium]